MRPLAVITQEPIDVGELQAHVKSAAFGAMAHFVGVVRDHDHGKQVVGLEYEVHPNAHVALQSILDSIAAVHHDVRIAVAHRFGNLQIGDNAFVAVVASAHRDAAFVVLRDVVERVKAELPIWKRQKFSDGSHEWVNFA